jgi:hypothetical protein
MTWRRGGATARGARLVAEVPRLDDRPGRDVRHAARRAVDAHRPVCVVAQLDVQHGQQLAVAPAALDVPGHGVAAAVHGVAQDVQPCPPTRTSSQSVTRGAFDRAGALLRGLAARQQPVRRASRVAAARPQGRTGVLQRGGRAVGEAGAVRQAHAVRRGRVKLQHDRARQQRVEDQQPLALRDKAPVLLALEVDAALGRRALGLGGRRDAVRVRGGLDRAAEVAEAVHVAHQARLLVQHRQRHALLRWPEADPVAQVHVALPDEGPARAARALGQLPALQGSRRAERPRAGAPAPARAAYRQSAAL